MKQHVLTIVRGIVAMITFFVAVYAHHSGAYDSLGISMTQRLRDAAENGETERVNMLLETGVDVNA